MTPLEQGISFDLQQDGLSQQLTVRLPEEILRPERLFLTPHILTVRRLNGYTDKYQPEPLWGPPAAIYNPFKSSFVTINENDWLVVRALEKGITDSQSVYEEAGMSKTALDNTINFLRRKGIVVTPDQYPSIKFPKPDELELYLGITGHCNLCCQGCTVDADKISFGKVRSMDLQVMESSLTDAVLSAQKAKMREVHVKIAGGEPMLPESFNMTVKALRKIGQLRQQYPDVRIRATILTNGSYLTQENIDILKEFNVAVSVSLWGIGAVNDWTRGARRPQDRYEYIIQGMKRLHEASIDHPNLTYNINHVIRVENAWHMADFIKAVWDIDSPDFIGRDWRWKYGKEPFNLGATLFRPSTKEEIGFLKSYGYDYLLTGVRNAFDVIRQLIEKGNPIPALTKIDTLTPFQATLNACGRGIDYIAVAPSGVSSSCHERMLTRDHVEQSMAGGSDLFESVNQLDDMKVEDTMGIKMTPPSSVDPKIWTTLALHGGAGCPNVAMLEHDRPGIPSSAVSQLYAPLLQDFISLAAMRELKLRGN